MSIESQTPQFGNETQTPAVEVSQTERNLNELVPILAHGLVRRIEQKGFSGKIRVSSMAGEDWGVAKSRDNTTDIPNIIIYPRGCLTGDKKVVNAQLRHEIGNLNYPIEGDLNNLKSWCEENNISPILLTSLVESVQEASVNYMEMRNSHSDSPEENFRALYEQDIDTARIVENISKSSPYKQAVDVSLLYSLSQVDLIPDEQFEQALADSHEEVQAAFDKQTLSVLSQAVKMSVPKKKIQLIKEYVWPKLSGLVALSSTDDLKKGGAIKKDEQNQEVSADEGLNESLVAKMDEMKKKLEEMKDQMKKAKQRPKSGSEKKESDQAQKSKKSERERPSQKDISSKEMSEQKAIKKQLEESLNDRLQDLKEEISELQKKPQEEQIKPESMEDIAQEADKMQAQTEESLQESREQLSPEDFEKMQELMEELKELEDVAKNLSNTELPEEDIEEEDESMTYNIKEYGINEQELDQEQLELLEKTRYFTKETSKTYRKVMRLLMSAYQKRNPNFKQSMVDKLKERGHDLPQFSIYSSESGSNFLRSNEELGLEGVEDDNFLLNFNLPKPFGKFWYKGGDGKKSQPVRDGEIEWGDFYRKSMPVIWNATDRAVSSGLYLDRLNSFGQHDYKKYYYLWETLKYQAPEYDFDQEDSEESGNDQEPSESEQGEEQGQDGQSGEGAEQGDSQESADGGQEQDDSGQGNEGGGEQGGEGGSDGVGAGAGTGGEGSGPGDFSPEQMKDFLSQMEQMIEDAKNEAEQSGELSSQTQEAIDQLLDQFSQMQDGLDGGQSPQELSEQMSESMQGMSDAMESMEADMQGEVQGEGQGEEGVGEQEGGGGPAGEGEGEGGSEGESSEGEPGEQSHDQFQKGGKNQDRNIDSLFSQPNEELLKQLQDSESLVGSKFSAKDESGNFIEKDLSESIKDDFNTQSESTNKDNSHQLETLEDIKRQQQSKMEEMYREMSGLDGQALKVYVEYMEDTKDFSHDLTDFFIDKFDLDKDYVYEKNQRRGARLQRGFTKNILGTKGRNTVIDPRSFERKRPPEKPQFAWSLIIDNSGSCSGEIIEQQKKLAVALVEVAKKLDIPLEIVTFGGPDEFTFLKSFEQDVAGDDLQKMVLLNADQGTPDVVTLDATCASMERFSDKFQRSYNFIYFMTDGQSGSGSIQEVLKKYKRDMVITGIGLAGAAQTISETWGKNAVAVPDVNKLSESFIRKIEDQIDQTFD